MFPSPTLNTYGLGDLLTGGEGYSRIYVSSRCWRLLITFDAARWEENEDVRDHVCAPGEPGGREAF